MGMMFYRNNYEKRKMWIYIIGLLCTLPNGAVGSYYTMEDHCNNEISFIWETIYQATLVLNDDYIYNKNFPYHRSSECETTLEAWLTRYPKFMFYFEDLELDCDDGHLEFYIGDTSNTRVTGLEYDVCGNDKPQGVFIVENQKMRIKYVPKKSQYIPNIFEIILTSYGEGSCPSYGHVCDNGRCIDGDLACNGYNSCGDDSGCEHEETSTGAIVGIVIGCLLALGLIISVVVCCFCCMKRSKGTTGTVQNTATTTTTQSVPYTSHPMTSQQPMYPMNQGSPYPTNMPTFPATAPTNVAYPNFQQQDNLRPIYGFNQGMNYQSSQGPHISPHASAPPPAYDEVVGNPDMKY